MKEKPVREWFLDVPWGKLAVVSWGDQTKPPVLMVHGYMDTAATFYPLVQLLPDTFYYVAFDLPGHGKSDATPGPPVTCLHYVDVTRQLVEHMRWDTFICIAHSMGYIVASFYNAAFPGHMTKMVSLDGAVAFKLMAMGDFYPLWFEHSYEKFYTNYWPAPKPILYTYEDAIAVLAQARAVTDDKAAILASRCLAADRDGMYRFSWDPKVKKLGTMIFTFESLYAIVAKSTPILNVIATETSETKNMDREFCKKMMEKLQHESPNYLILYVKESHDVHFTNPELFVKVVIEFLNRDFGVKCKL